MQVFTIYNDEFRKENWLTLLPTNFRKLVTILRELPHDTLGNLIEFRIKLGIKVVFMKMNFLTLEISGIDLYTGEIKNFENIKVIEAPSRAKMIVKYGDIIVSTTRPHRGAIAYIDQQYDNYIASTGFVILRKLKNTNVSKECLFFILRSDLVLQQMLQRSSVVIILLLLVMNLKKIVIPVPSVDIQNEIVNLMQFAYHHKQQIDKVAKELLSGIDGYIMKN